MKRKIALVLVAAMTVSALMACGKKEEKKDTTTKAPVTTEAPTTEAPTEAETTEAAPAKTYNVVKENTTDALVVGNEDGTSGFWTEFSDYYVLSGEGKVVLDVTIKGTATGNWNNIAVVCSNAERGADGYAEYAVTRMDNWGWGGGDNLSMSGNAIEYTKSFESFEAFAFAATANNSKTTVTIEKSADGYMVTFDIVGDNGETAQTTAKVTEAIDGDAYFFFTVDGSCATVNSVSFN